MTRAIMVCFHKYTPFGGEFYDPILDFFIQQMKKYESEYDMIYINDSNWNIDLHKLKGMKVKVNKTNPSQRYYDTYKQWLPFIDEDLVLFMDNDMVVYRKDIIRDTFWTLEGDMPSHDIDAQIWDGCDVVSIMDTIGTWKNDKLKLGNKFCPYWFATRKELLMKYLDVDWASDMPDFETLGKLTKAMIENGCLVYELEDDKEDMKKDFGYFHIRAGSTIAYLLATKHYGDKKTYTDYLKNQPKSEILRHCKWYKYMGGDPTEILNDL